MEPKNDKVVFLFYINQRLTSDVLCMIGWFKNDSILGRDDDADDADDADDSNSYSMKLNDLKFSNKRKND
jgi:hypothetical protein